MRIGLADLVRGEAVVPELVINVSNVVSPLCYSVVRLEPYTTCGFRCSYCYARWYWGCEGVINVRCSAIKAFRRAAWHVVRRGLRPIPARLATLTDPFHPPEEIFKASLELLKVAKELEYPLIINTKGVLYRKEPWLKELEELLDSDLAVLQVSIATLNEAVSKRLEPLAPPPGERLAAARDLSSRGLPVVIRLSPYIPSVSTEPSIEDFVNEVRDVGAKIVVAESLRLEKGALSSLIHELGINVSRADLEPYSFREDAEVHVLKFGLGVRLREYVRLARYLSNAGVGFATCKEGLFELHTAPNCCGMHLLKRDVALRPTLYEVFRYLVTHGPIDLCSIEEVLYGRICRQGSYICGDDLREYPRELYKYLRNHEKRLIKVLKDADVLPRVAPNIAIEDGKLVPKKVVYSST